MEKEFHVYTCLVILTIDKQLQCIAYGDINDLQVNFTKHSIEKLQFSFIHTYLNTIDHFHLQLE